MSTAELHARGDSVHEERPQPPDEPPVFVECSECATQNIKGTWYCSHCSHILPPGDYENPEQQQTAANNLNRAAEAYAARLRVRWTFRLLRGPPTQHSRATHEIRNKHKRALQLRYQSITHRFDEDAVFRSHQGTEGRTRDTMIEYDRIAAAPSVVHGIPRDERARRFGYQPRLALERPGADTHSIAEAPNYQELLEAGPPAPSLTT